MRSVAAGLLGAVSLATSGTAGLPARADVRPYVVARSAPGSAATASPVAAVKPPLAGLTVESGAPPAGYPIANRVILVSWAALEPARGRFRFAAVSAALAQAARAGQHAKLRVLAGAQAPGWAKALSGGTFDYVGSTGGTVRGMPRFWDAGYGTAYHQLMAALAAAFDGSATLREVALTRCMAQWAEPLWREFGRHTVDAERAHGQGYTDEADQACETAMVTEDAAVWHRTDVDLALTPAAYLDRSGHAYFSRSRVQALAVRLRATVGRRGLLENNELTAGVHGSWLYRLLASAGGPLTFQTEAYPRLRGVTGLLAALREGCTVMGAGSVELPGGFQAASPAQLTPYARACARNAAG